MAGLRRSGLLGSVGSQCKDHFVSLKRRRDHDVAHAHSQRVPSFHFEQTRQHEASHHSCDEEVYNLEKKVEWLRRYLRRQTRIRQDRTPSPNQHLSTRSDGNYQPRSRTPPSESFMSSSRHTSGWKHYCNKSRTPPRRGQGHDAMGKALLQISRSPFSRCIEQAKFPCHFNQPISPSIMVKLILSNMWAILTRGWPFTQRIKP